MPSDGPVQENDSPGSLNHDCCFFNICPGFDPGTVSVSFFGVHIVVASEQESVGPSPLDLLQLVGW